MKLLIVEDNLEMRRLIRQIVRKTGNTIFECGDGKCALISYREHSPDWVLMDIEMPGMDGIAATREIIAAYPLARIAIVTDHDNPNLRDAAREAGAARYIVKENLLELRTLAA